MVKDFGNFLFHDLAAREWPLPSAALWKAQFFPKAQFDCIGKNHRPFAKAKSHHQDQQRVA